MKTKITIIITFFLSFIMTTCSGFEDNATLTLHLGGSSNNYSASALTNWPPEDVDLDSLRFYIKLSGQKNEITEEVLGSERSINLTVTPGDWIIEIKAHVIGDNPNESLYARGVKGVTLRPGRNNVPVTMRRAGIYELYIDVIPSEKSVQQGGSHTFTAIPSHGLKNKDDYNPSDPDLYVWTVSGNTKNGTTINQSSGYLEVDLNEEATTLMVKATYKNDNSIYETATVTVTDAVTGPFVPVTNITGVSAAVVAGEPLTLTGTVEPTNATNKTIVWSVSNAGSTGAAISGNTLTTTNAGTVTVKATIADGDANGDYTKDFSITIVDSSNVAMLTLNGVNTFHTTLKNALDSITGNNQTATITVLKNIPSVVDSISIASGRTIYLVSDGAKEIQLGANGNLFIINSSSSLTLEGPITLIGRNNNTNSLMMINSGGTLVMEDGVVITGNTTTGAVAGGVTVHGAFSMNGGTISGNSTAGDGGAISITNGSFNMTGGTISGNSAAGDGGAISITNGSFNMTGGTISGNSTTGDGGAITMTSTGSSINMAGGTITGNTSFSRGGGIYMTGGTFTKSGNSIITGYNSTTELNGNVVMDPLNSGEVLINMGHAVYIATPGITYKRESTAGYGVNLNSSLPDNWE